MSKKILKPCNEMKKLYGVTVEGPTPDELKKMSREDLEVEIVAASVVNAEKNELMNAIFDLTLAAAKDQDQMGHLREAHDRIVRLMRFVEE